MYAISLGDDGAELRPLEPWHAEEFLAHLERGRDFINAYVPFGQTATDVASARAVLQRYADMRAADTGSLHGIWLDGKLVGGVLFLNFDAENANCEVGCWLEPAGDRAGADHPCHADPHRLGRRRPCHPPGRVDRGLRQHAEPERGAAAGHGQGRCAAGEISPPRCPARLADMVRSGARMACGT